MPAKVVSKCCACTKRFDATLADRANALQSKKALLSWTCARRSSGKQKPYQSAVLAQSFLLDFSLIGRMPYSPRKLCFLGLAHGVVVGNKVVLIFFIYQPSVYQKLLHFSCRLS